MSRSLKYALLTAVILSLVLGVARVVQWNIRWRAQVSHTLTQEREQYLQTQRDLTSRLSAARDSADAYRAQAFAATERAQLAAGRLTHLRAQLDTAASLRDSLDQALAIVALQDTIISQQDTALALQRFENEKMHTGLLLALARADTAEARVRRLEGVLGAAPIIQPAPKRDRWRDVKLVAKAVAVTVLVQQTLERL